MRTRRIRHLPNGLPISDTPTFPGSTRSRHQPSTGFSRRMRQGTSPPASTRNGGRRHRPGSPSAGERASPLALHHGLAGVTPCDLENSRLNAARMLARGLRREGTSSRPAFGHDENRAFLPIQTAKVDRELTGHREHQAASKSPMEAIAYLDLSDNQFPNHAPTLQARAWTLYNLKRFEE